jgi:hypothetical protein
MQQLSNNLNWCRFLVIWWNLTGWFQQVTEVSLRLWPIQLENPLKGQFHENLRTPYRIISVFKFELERIFEFWPWSGIFFSWPIISSHYNLHTDLKETASWDFEGIFISSFSLYIVTLPHYINFLFWAWFQSKFLNLGLVSVCSLPATKS